MLFIISLILISFSNITNGKYINKTIVMIDGLSKYYNSVDITNNIEIIMSSKYKVPFSVTIYTPNGKPYVYKGNTVKHSGTITFYEIDNFINSKNQLKIKIKLTHNNKEQLLEYIEYLFSIVALFTIVSITLFKKDSKLSSLLLILLMIIRLYIDYDFSNLGYIIFRKIMF